MRSRRSPSSGMHGPLRRFPQTWLAWTILWAVLLVVLFLSSEGERCAKVR